MRRAATPRGFGNGSVDGGGRIPSRPWATGDSRRPRCVRMPTRSLPFAGEFAALGLTPFASKCEVKSAYKSLALKYHPDVIRVDIQEKDDTFREIKSAYERLMAKFEEEKSSPSTLEYGGGEEEDGDEWEEWEEWMGSEGGFPVLFS